MKESPIERVRDALGDSGASRVKRSGAGWMARCPAHDDRSPSLSVRRGEDGRVLIHCHAGCPPEAVVAALGLVMADLMPESERAPTTGNRDLGEPLAEYDYLDYDGTYKFSVVRFPDHKFLQGVRDLTSGRYSWGINGANPVLFRGPKVAAEVRRGGVVYAPEGEKDVLALERAGVVATCNPGGAGKWRDEFSAVLKSANLVRIVADKDVPGRAHAAQVAASLRAQGTRCEILEAADGKDASDHLAAGRTVEEFVGVPEGDAVADGEQAVGVPLVQTVTASEIVATSVTWLWEGFVAQGFLNLLVGAPGAGKSTILYDVAAKASRAGSTVLIATAEDHHSAIVRPRLEAAGADLSRVHVVTEELSLPGDVERIEATVRAFGAALLVIDPLVAFFDGKTDSHKDASVRRTLKPLGGLAERTGAAVVTVVHTNKGASDDPQMRVSGSIGFQGAARHALLAAADPDDESGEARILAVWKSNLALFPPPVSYRVVSAEVAGPVGPVGTSRIEWGAERPGFDPRALLRQPDREGGKLAEATRFLVEAGVSSRARPASELLSEAAAHGIANRTLQRAREALGIARWKDGMGPWMWGPEQGANEGANVRLGTLASSSRPGETVGAMNEGAKVPDTTDRAVSLLADAFGPELREIRGAS